MTARIIAGEWRGRPLAVPTGAEVRPTAARAREALFSMLASRLGAFDDLRVLDLFAGSGALGLEALSRGAAHARFVERSPAALTALRANIAAFGADARATVFAQSADTLGRAPEPHDLVFLDPPYGAGLVQPTLARLVGGGWVAAGAWIAVETARTDPLEGWPVETDRRHGKARLRLLRPAPPRPSGYLTVEGKS